MKNSTTVIPFVTMYGCAVIDSQGLGTLQKCGECDEICRSTSERVRVLCGGESYEKNTPTI